MDDGATSTIEIRGDHSSEIAGRRGVKDECALSPLLFNLCLEPVLQAIRTNLARSGASRAPQDTDDPIRFPVQAYADDVLCCAWQRQWMI
jgi:hypothetical protein